MISLARCINDLIYLHCDVEGITISLVDFDRGANYINNGLISHFIYLTVVSWDNTEADYA